MKRTFIVAKFLLVFILAFASFSLALEEEEKRITFSAKGMEIRDLFDLLNRQYGLNIVATKEVKGEISVHLINVPLDEALESITSSSGYAFTRVGNIIQVFLPEEKPREAGKPVKPEVLPERKVRAFPLNFLQAAQVQKMIEPLLSPGVGSVQGIEEGNLLLVKDTPARVEEIAALIEDLDRESRQVRISAKIVMVDRSKSDSVGFDWYTRFRASGSSRPITFPFDKRHAGGIFWPENNPFGEGGESGSSGGPEFDPKGSFPYANKEDFAFGILNATEFSLLIEFLNTSGDTEIIAEPEITTLNNRTAKLISGEVVKIPMYAQNIERAVSTVTGFEEIKTGTNLEVTPRILDKTSVILKVKPEVSRITGFRGEFGELPDVATRNAEAEVIVEDGKTLIIAGLVLTDKRKKESGVPLLKEIPLLGYLFRYSSEETVKSDLIIFITPRIIDREALRKDAEGRIRYEGEWICKASVERAARLRAALFSSLPERRLRGLRSLREERNEEVLSLLKAEEVLARIMENDAEEEIRTQAVALLASQYPAAYYGWLDSLVLAGPEEFSTGFLVSYLLEERARPLRDATLMAALLVNREETTKRLMQSLGSGSTSSKIHAVEALCRFPFPEAEGSLAEAANPGFDPVVRLFALSAFESLSKREGCPGSGRISVEPDFQALLSRVRNLKKPSVAGSIQFRSKIESALQRLAEKAPRFHDLICLCAREIVEGDSWCGQSADGGRIQAKGEEVENWPPDRIAFETIYCASLLYQQDSPSPAFPEVWEGARDQFWVVLSLAGASKAQEDWVQRFFGELFGSGLPTSGGSPAASSNREGPARGQEVVEIPRGIADQVNRDLQWILVRRKASSQPARPEK